MKTVVVTNLRKIHERERERERKTGKGNYANDS